MTKSAKTPDPDGKPTVREVIIAKPDCASAGRGGASIPAGAIASSCGQPRRCGERRVTTFFCLRRYLLIGATCRRPPNK